MPLNGNTVNIAVNPIGAKQLVDSETIVPNHLELRNGVRSDAGFFKSRPGYAQEWDVGVDEQVTLLIPFKRSDTSGLGFGVTSSGRVFEFLSGKTTQEYTGATLNGAFRPTWAVFDGIPIIADGQAPIEIDVDVPATTTISALAGSPPAGKFIAVIAQRVVISGQDETSFDWTGPGDRTNWSGSGSGNSNVTGHGEKIQYMQVKDTDLYFFKDHSIEIWSNVEGDEVVARKGIITATENANANLNGTKNGP